MPRSFAKKSRASVAAAAVLLAVLTAASVPHVAEAQGVIARGDALAREASERTAVSREEAGEPATIVTRDEAISGGPSVAAAARTQKKKIEFRISESADAADSFTRSVGSSASAAESVARTAPYVKEASMTRVFRWAGKFEAKHREAGLHLWYQAEVDVTGAATDEDVTARVESALSTMRTADGVVEAHLQETPELVDFEISDPGYGNSRQRFHYGAVNLPEAWKIQRGQKRLDGGYTVVQLIDSGVEDDHNDLQRNKWRNEGEVCGDGIDNDGNGFTDDCHGYNHADEQGFPLFGDGSHGTHCTGTVAADNNDLGVAGVAGGESCASETGVVYMTSTTFGANTVDRFAEAFVYGADMGADVSSNSWGYGGCNGGSANFGAWPQTSERVAVDYFVGQNHKNGVGGIVVFAAGNSNEDCRIYPAYYDKIVAVASTGNGGNSIGDYSNRSTFSNYGKSWLDIAAPGGNIYSTVASSSYAYYSGTSMACPHVSGVFGLMINHCPMGTGLGPGDYKSCMYDTATPIQYRQAGDLGAGLMDAYEALKCMTTRYPEKCLAFEEVDVCVSEGPPRPSPPPSPPSPPPPPPPDCSSCTFTAQVSVTSDDYCGETSWEITGGVCPLSNAALAEGDACPNSSTTTRTVGGLCPSVEYTLTMNDSYGDGMCCQFGTGSYTLTVDGNTVKTGGSFGSAEETVFTIEAPSPPPSSPPPSSPPPSSGEWILTAKRKNKTCTKACTAIGKTCVSEEMSKLSDATTLEAALATVPNAPSCDTVKGTNGKTNKKAGVPGVRLNKRTEKNICFPIKAGVAASCDTKQLGNMRSLCWCE